MNFQIVMSCLDEIEKLATSGSMTATPKVKAPAPTAPRPSAPAPKAPSLKPVAPKPPAGAGRVATQAKPPPPLSNFMRGPGAPKTMLGGQMARQRWASRQGQVKPAARLAGGSVMRARAAPAAQRGIRNIASTPSPLKGMMPSKPKAPVGGANPVARTVSIGKHIKRPSASDLGISY